MKRLIFILTIINYVIAQCNAQSVSSLWNEYKNNRYNHPNIPNNSFAGYGTGLSVLPNPSGIPVDVTALPYVAIPNDTIDDQPAIQEAINAVGAAGGGIVYVPAGNYILHKPIYIKFNNVIVRGDGSSGAAATILDFKFSIYSMFKPDIGTAEARSLWWSTGLVWIGPGDTFKPNGAPDMKNGFEDWRFSSTLAQVIMPSEPGSFSVIVNSADSLSAGMRILLCYEMPADRSFIKHIYGHTPTESGIDSNKYVGDCSNIISPLEKYFFLPVCIKSINGDTVIFDRPLRIKCDPGRWPATLKNIQSIITESGLENVQIKGYNTRKMVHLGTPTWSTAGGKATSAGWNGVYINRSWNCWVNKVRFVNLECGIIFSSAKNCSVLNTFITSTDDSHWYHHPFAMRLFSSDNLVENFTIDGPGGVRHGINAEWFSSGNVYSKGLMKIGTFDSHRAVAFDLIRTEITVANDTNSLPGGADVSGPYAGKRFAHWNIVQKIQPGYPYDKPVSRNGKDIFDPLQFPMSVFVAITGAKDTSAGEHMPPPLPGGDLGSIVVTDSITDTGLVNLYHAELMLRKNTPEMPNKHPSVSIISPAGNRIFISPATIIINAAATDTDGTISNVSFYAGSKFLKRVILSPYSCTLPNLHPGSYSLTVEATDNHGAVTISAAVNITVVRNKPPTVNIISPPAMQTFYAPANIYFQAAAHDSDGRIAEVSFYNGTMLLVSEHKVPYSYLWQDVPEGIYTITAVARDNRNARGTSSPLIVTVVSPGVASVNERSSPGKIKAGLNVR